MASKKIIYKGKEIKTISDLPEGFGGLNKIKVKAPNGTIGWWVSQWNKGVWLRKEKGDTQVHPVFVEDLKECLTWKIVEIDENAKEE
jgi:hypothetical protein